MPAKLNISVFRASFIFHEKVMLQAANHSQTQHQHHALHMRSPYKQKISVKLFISSVIFRLTFVLGVQKNCLIGWFLWVLKKCVLVENFFFLITLFISWPVLIHTLWKKVICKNLKTDCKTVFDAPCGKYLYHESSAVQKCASTSE